MSADIHELRSLAVLPERGNLSILLADLRKGYIFVKKNLNNLELNKFSQTIQVFPLCKYDLGCQR